MFRSREILQMFYIFSWSEDMAVYLICKYEDDVTTSGIIFLIFHRTLKDDVCKYMLLTEAGVCIGGY